jgi:hypothetical protein
LPRITQLKDKTEVDAGQSIFITTLNDIENKVSEDEHKTTATLNYNPKNGILTKSCVERGCFLGIFPDTKRKHCQGSSGARDSSFL